MAPIAEPARIQMITPISVSFIGGETKQLATIPAKATTKVKLG